MGYATTISSWGNSEAVRIPKSILRAAGLHAGDKVNISADAQGRIAITPARQEHRRVKPQSGVNYSTLFANYEPAYLPADPWPTEHMYGAEFDSWAH